MSGGPGSVPHVTALFFGRAVVCLIKVIRHTTVPTNTVSDHCVTCVARHVRFTSAPRKENGAHLAGAEPGAGLVVVDGQDGVEKRKEETGVCRDGHMRHTFPGPDSGARGPVFLGAQAHVFELDFRCLSRLEK